jgi:Membrane protein implicated in regulation of membrane protease activity
MSPFLWILLGIVLSLLELAHPVMIFFPIGLSAIATGVFGLLIEYFTKIPYEKMLITQLITFFVVSAINIYLLRKISKEWISVKTPKSSQPENAILGKEVYAKEDAKAKTMIKVESPSPILGVNLWHAKVLDDVKAGDKLVVVGHEGGILVCKKASYD